MMPQLEDVLDTIEAVTGEPEVRVHRDLRLFDLQLLDSLRTISLLLALNERFGIEISLSEVDRETWATPERIAAFMEARFVA
jgi:D-alanine--poly(phosphoribitol) ligase subunit 2